MAPAFAAGPAFDTGRTVSIGARRDGDQGRMTGSGYVIRPRRELP